MSSFQSVSPTFLRASLALVLTACGSSSTGGGNGGSGSENGNGGTSADGGSQSTPTTDGGTGLGSPDDATASIGDSAFPVTDAPAPSDGAAPPGFWGDPTTIPPAKNVMTFKFLNRTNGKYADTEVYWSFKNGTISETHSIADESTYDMPANNSGRMYFYICAAGDATCATDPTKSLYYDFIEHTIGATQYNGNTTRVDAFGLKIAMRLHCSDGFDLAVGEDYETFLEDRTTTFAKFISEVPAEFQPLAQAPHAPYRIVEPGAGGFNTGGANATYYDDFVNTMWANNGLTIAKPGPNGSNLGSYPDISAAIYRHVGSEAGTFAADGTLTNKTLWASASTFYSAAPADYYAKFWHTHGLNGKAYGFPYDDVGGYSSYVSHSNPQYMIVAIGW